MAQEIPSFSKLLRDHRTRLGWTQRVLAERFGEVAWEVDESLISRWENEERKPDRDVVKAVCEALGLNLLERDQLLLAADYAPLDSTERQAVLQYLRNIEGGVREVKEITTDIRELIRQGYPFNPFAPSIYPSGGMGIALATVQRPLLPGAVLALAGILMSQTDVHGDTAYLVYVLAGIISGLAPGLLRMVRDRRLGGAGSVIRQDHRATWIGELVFLSLFAGLTAILLPAAITGMDIYGFFTVASLTGTVTPLMYAALVNLGISLSGLLIFRLLWNWQHSRGSEHDRFREKGLKIVIPTMLLLLVPLVLFSGLGPPAYFTAYFVVVSAALVLIIDFSDPRLHLGEWMAKLTFQIMVTSVILLMVLVVAAILLVAYNLQYGAEGDFPEVYRNLLGWRREFDASALGYTGDEFRRLNVYGFYWMGVANVAYLLFLGSQLLLTTYRHQLEPALKRSSES